MSKTTIPTGGITADAINGTLIADDAINSEHYTDGSIDTAHIGDDQVTSAKATGLGITMADQWRITSSFAGDANPIASNWERNDTDFAQIGTGLTESSGIFTFPSTGIYRVDFQHIGTTENNNPSQYNEAHIRVTTNNSTYNSRATTSSLGITTNGTNGQFSSYCSCIVDVTNTSNVKIATYVEVADNGTSTIGGTDRQFTGITVIRLGDT
jgi:hypothetical protein